MTLLERSNGFCLPAAGLSGSFEFRESRKQVGLTVKKIIDHLLTPLFPYPYSFILIINELVSIRVSSPQQSEHNRKISSIYNACSIKL